MAGTEWIPLEAHAVFSRRLPDRTVLSTQKPCNIREASEDHVIQFSLLKMGKPRFKEKERDSSKGSRTTCHTEEEVEAAPTLGGDAFSFCASTSMTRSPALTATASLPQGQHPTKWFPAPS